MYHVVHDGQYHELNQMHGSYHGLSTPYKFHFSFS